VCRRVPPCVDRVVAALIARPDNGEQLSRLPQYTTPVFGGMDALLPQADLLPLQAALLQAHRVRYDTAGHAAFIDHATAFNNLLEGDAPSAPGAMPRWRHHAGPDAANGQRPDATGVGYDT
jgi:pimeloyl-ACP methyl ester carboxylesterase